MRRNQIKPGETYVAKAGGWLFDVKCVVEEDGVLSVIYEVVQTGREGECTLAAFSARVERRLDPDAEPARKARRAT